MTYIIHGSAMTDREAAHREIRRALELPEYYGANLDALWDCLTDLYEGEIVLTEAVQMLNALKVYGCKLVKTFMESCEETKLTFTLE